MFAETIEENKDKVLYQLLKIAATEEFKAILKRIR